MNHPAIHTTLVILFMLLSRAGAQEERLSYNLRPGERYMLEIDIQQNTHSESLRNDEISMYSLARIHFRVDSTGPGGCIHMTAAYHDLLLSMLAPSLQIDINSAQGQDPLLSAMVRSLEDRPFNVVMDHAGELQSLDGLRELFSFPDLEAGRDSLETEVILNTLNEVYGPDAFTSLFGLFVSIYPVVQPIRNWTRDVTYYFNTKPVRISNRYLLSRATEEYIIIQGIGMLESESAYTEKNGSSEVTSTVSGSQTYDIRADRRTGWPEKALSRQRILIESTVVRDPVLPRGLKIPSYTETVFEIKGAKL